MSKETEAKFERLGDAVDSLITLDVSARGAIGTLYEGARSKYGKSLTYIAAKALKERVGPENTLYWGQDFQYAAGFRQPSLKPMDRQELLRLPEPYT